ncbi:MAG: hypothetical protein V4573_03755 [Pseudomonadota bacterium]
MVTGHNQNGQSVITIDDDAPNVTAVEGWPGLYIRELWVTDEMPIYNMGNTDQGARKMRHDPTPSGSILKNTGAAQGRPVPADSAICDLFAPRNVFAL